jgi:uroporphyrin-III C-methyltransferase
VSGIVYLVGAGPGDPRLITLRGAEVLRSADMVVHDRLSSAALLDLASARAERVDAGKSPGGGRSQDDINRLLVARARAGKSVVRLKGGDPFVFGRGGEEALACARAGVPVEIVPGVSSAVAAPASVGIPLTHRGLSSSVTVLTAAGAGGQDPDLRASATASDTLVVLMAAGRLEATCRSLIEGGRRTDEPAAMIQWATTSRQRSVTGTLADLPRLAAGADIGPPATLVVGSVVTLKAHVAGALEDARLLSSEELSPQGTSSKPSVAKSLSKAKARAIP